MYHIRNYSVHTCRLEGTGSDSCLPKRSPFLSRCKKLKRILWRWTILYSDHPLVPLYCRSGASILTERRRHIYTYPWFIIHPLSKLSMYNDILATLLWICSFIADPLLTAFWNCHNKFLALDLMSSMVNGTLLLQCCLAFFIGYCTKKTKEIVLEPRKIMAHYFKTYFIIDFIGSFPFGPILFYFCPDCDEVFYNLVYLIRTVKIIRIYTCYLRMKLVATFFKFSDSVRTITSIALITLLVLHWLSCGLFIHTKIFHYIDGYKPGFSIFSQLEVSDEFILTDWYVRYIVCIYIVAAKFCGAGSTHFDYTYDEQAYLFCLSVLGQVYYITVFFLIYLVFKAKGSSETSYEEFIVGVHAFMDSRRLPKSLRDRVLLYYQRMFQNKYFRETTIKALLSEHLEKEILLHSCRHLIHHVDFFTQLPKSVVGVILDNLKQEVYLPQDVILRAEDRLSNMFFISRGTVAVYNTAEQEIFHLVDGMHFGMLPINKLRLDTLQYTYVAVEVTECYKWDRHGYNTCYNMYKDISVILGDLHLKRLRQYRHREELQRKAQQHNVVSDLQQGKILDKGQLRIRRDQSGTLDSNCD